MNRSGWQSMADGRGLIVGHIPSPRGRRSGDFGQVAKCGRFPSGEIEPFGAEAQARLRATLPEHREGNLPHLAT